MWKNKQVYACICVVYIYIYKTIHQGSASSFSVCDRVRAIWTYRNLFITNVYTAALNGDIGHQKDCSKRKQVHTGFTLVIQAGLNLSIGPSILGICDGNPLQDFGHVLQP
jgi:hypothetical protein